MSTVYKSIGTKAAYNTGTVSLDVTKLIVTLSGGIFATNWGKGDKITIDVDGTPETGYVLSRDSDTQLTLQTAMATQHSGQDYQIERAYSTLASWQSATQGDLVTATEIRVGVAYNDSSFARVTISGSTVNSSYYRRLETGSGQRHNGVPKTGASYNGVNIVAAGSWTNCMSVQEPYCQVDGFIGDAKVLDGTGCFYISHATGNIKVSNCIGYNTKNGSDTEYYAFNLDDGGNSNKVYNCLSLSCRYGGLIGAWKGGSFYNCTVINAMNRGFHKPVGATNGYVRNCLAYGSTGADFLMSGSTITYCASEDDTADDNGGAGNRVNQTFSFYDSGASDYHIDTNDTGAQGYGIGPASDANVPSTDIDGNSRSGTTCDIGMNEAVDPKFTPSFSNKQERGQEIGQKVGQD